jgi:mRNA-degrading endonuclease RelE of RelBE toxin-antitoxin system
MRTKIRVEEQVEAFVKSLAPEPRKRLRLAIRQLAENRGNIRLLEGNLAGYCRLSVAGYRVIFKEREWNVDCASSTASMRNAGHWCIRYSSACWLSRPWSSC